MRRAVAFVAFAAAGSLAAAPARADGPPAVPLQPAPEEAAPPAAPREEFGWQVLVADGAGIVTTIVATTTTDSWLVFAPYLAASPTVHLAHGDIKGAVGGLLLHVLLPFAGGLIGYQFDSANCTQGEWTCGFWGVALGIPLGILVGLNQRARTALWPLLLFFQAIGDIAWLPILVIWFGYGLVTMTFVIVYTVIFPVVINTVLGVRSIHVNMHRAALSLGASRAQVLREVVLPGALPNIMTGLRNGLGYGWRALIAAEIIVGTSGIGFLMFDARRAGSVVEILLGMIILGILWYIVDSWILAPIERATGQRWGLVTG